LFLSATVVVHTNFIGSNRLSNMSSEQPDFQLFSSLRFDVRLRECEANTAVGPEPSPFYMLPFHRDRMLEAAQHFDWPDAEARLAGSAGLEHLLKSLKAAIDTNSGAPLRVRMLLDQTGNITLESFPTPSTAIRNLFPTRLPPPGSAALYISPLTGGALILGPDDSLSQQGPGYGDPEREQAWAVMVDPARTEPSPFTTYKTTSRDMYTEARVRVGIEAMTEPKEVLIISTDGNQIMEGSVTSVLFWRGGRWVTPPVSSGGQAGTTRRWLLKNGLCEEEAVSSGSLVDGEECWLSNGVRGLIWGKVKL
jgi:4-amino-4-deoxychorismate lyase